MGSNPRTNYHTPSSTLELPTQVKLLKRLKVAVESKGFGCHLRHKGGRYQPLFYLSVPFNQIQILGINDFNKKGLPNFFSPT